MRHQFRADCGCDSLRTEAATAPAARRASSFTAVMTCSVSEARAVRCANHDGRWRTHDGKGWKTKVAETGCKGTDPSHLTRSPLPYAHVSSDAQTPGSSRHVMVAVHSRRQHRETWSRPSHRTGIVESCRRARRSAAAPTRSRSLWRRLQNLFGPDSVRQVFPPLEGADVRQRRVGDVRQRFTCEKRLVRR